jgi:hypothetical protein
MNIWKYRQIILDNFKNILYDSICERNIPNGLLKKYIIRKDNIYKYDINKSYINTYFFDSPVHIIGYHLSNDKWYPVFNGNYHKTRGYVNLQFFFNYSLYLKRVKKRAILTLFLVHGFDGNIIKNISKYL